MGLTCNFHRNLRFFSYCNPRSSQFKTASGQPLSHPSTPQRQWCSSTLSVQMRHKETEGLSLGYTEIPRQRNNDQRSSGVMSWSWVSPLPSYNTLLSLNRVKPSASAPSLLGWGWDPAAQSLGYLSLVFSLPCYGSTMEGHPTIVFWALSMEPGEGRTLGEAVQWGKAKARLAVQRFCSDLGMLSWLGCIPWGPVSALWSRLNWGVWVWLKVTLVSALGLQSCAVALGELPLGKASFSAVDFSETWFRPSVISFALYWLLLRCSKWLRGKG